MRRTLLLVGLLGLLVGLTSCGADEPQVGPTFYGISYPTGAAAYDDAVAQGQYDACAALPGAQSAGTDQSLPPGRTLRFTGSKGEQRAVVSCLRALSGTQLNGPFDGP